MRTRTLTTLLTTLCLTVALSAPAAAQSATTKWQGLLGNQVLTQVIKDDGSAVQQVQGAKIQVAAGSVITELHLCKDGSFLRVQKITSGGESVQLGNISAKSAAGSVIKKWTGKWKLTEADAVSATVALTPKANSEELDDEDAELSIQL